MNEKCPLYKNGLCEKTDLKRRCVDCCSDLSWFDEEMNVCEVNEVCLMKAPYENHYFKLTKEQLEMLIDGKVLYFGDLEDCVFIALEQNGK